MAVKFTKPGPSEDFETGRDVAFSGTADAPVTVVSLVADDQFPLGVAPVVNGTWELSRAFSSPGEREITANGLDAAENVVARAVVRVVVRPRSDICEPREELFVIGGHPVFRLMGSKAIFFRAGMTIDADGSPHAYHPNGRSGLDDLRNAMNGTKFVGVVTDSSGIPVVQGPGDPAPGFFVSPTSLSDGTIADRRDPRRNVDSEKIPYIALSGAANMQSLVGLGDFVAVHNGRNGKVCFGIYADIGPKKRLGEGSIALAKALGIPSSPRVGGEEESKILYVVFAGSRKAFGRAWTKDESVAVINEHAGRHFDEWGGTSRMRACFADLG